MAADQSRALNALAPFLALSKSATSPRAAADLITQATSAPNTYVFAELLQQANICALAKDEQYGAHFTLLETFAWGTWETYKAAGSLPALSEAQALKLRLLSLLTIAAEKGKTHNLRYSSLCARLDLSSPAELESLVTCVAERVDMVDIGVLVVVDLEMVLLVQGDFRDAQVQSV